MKEFTKLVNNEEMSINRELFQRNFKFQRLSSMLRELYSTENKRNNCLVNMIKSGLRDLKDQIGQMSEDEIKIERPDKIVDIVERIPEFNRQHQEGQELKILTPNQTLTK